MFLVEITYQAYLKDAEGERAEANLLMLAHYSPANKHVKVVTSTTEPKVC